MLSPNSSHRDERTFGLLVGFVFAAIGVLWLYRGRFFPLAVGFAVAGALLIALGAIAPRLLIGVRRYWMRYAEAMGHVATAVILFVVFFAVIVPIGVVRRAFGADPLRRRGPAAPSYWEPYPARDPRHYERMY